jgi:hypothetical protein
MAFQTISRRSYDGFFAFEPGNSFLGNMIDEDITGQTDTGKEKGYLVFELLEPCAGRNKREDVKLAKGQIMAVPITSATRDLIGCVGKVVKGTFLRFKKSPAGDHEYHEWKLEVDDGT